MRLVAVDGDPEVKCWLARVDALQERRRWLAFPVAVWKKFGDDRAGNLAALISYYAFFSIFPLLLVLVTILGFVLQGQPKLEASVFRSVLGQFPIIGQHTSFRPLTGSLAGLVIGLLLGLWSGLGVAGTAQTAFDAVYEVPRDQRAGFVPRTLRSLVIVVVFGLGFVVTTALSGLITGAGSYGLALGTGLRVLGAIVQVSLNVGLFLVLFRLLTAVDVTWREALPGATVAAVAWEVLQLVGTSLVAHKLKGASSTYGTFAFVIGLLSWFYLQAQVTLFAAEINVVRARGLWPRSMFGPPRTEADEAASTAHPRRERQPEIDVSCTDRATGPPADGT